MQWLRVKEIVGDALERSAEGRSAFLDQICFQDEVLRAEVDSLLAAYTQADGFSRYIPGAAHVTGLEAARTIGAYRLERELGTGGMGQVWLAEQTEPVRRRVALKVIKSGLYDATVTERFLAERQSLALMNHPAIAKVFDAGTTAAGQPYFVMEYVEGLPIADYCNAKGLSVPDRLKLFLQVCEGVEHAHRKAIIHRDLKPSNILVVEIDGKPAPRIIDFGLAKSAAPAVADQTLLTQIGSFLGTPGYMSPEQADPGVDDIDTRTDVYSLGAVLYELLTGFLPFDPQRWKKQRLDEVLREIRETDPPRPSAKVSTSKTNPASGDARQLARLLRGDLDWITLKALERDRDRRYGSVSDLAADIERHLESRPVKARPASRGYRLRKYIRRNRVAVAVCGGVLALLIVLAAAQNVQLRHIKRERDRADVVTKFMTRMFQVSDPSEARGNSVTAREILDKGSQSIKSELAGDPELQAELMQVMGEVYMNLGLSSRARPLIEKSLDTRRSLFGPDDPKTLSSMNNLAWFYYETGHIEDAVKLQRDTVERLRRKQGPDDPDLLKSMENLGIFYSEEGHVPEAEKLHREILAVCRSTLPPEAKETLMTMNNLAADLIRERKLQEAKTLLTETLSGERRSFGPNDPLTLMGMNNLADVLLHLGQYPEAEKLLEETRDIERRTFGPDHPNTAGATYNLACVAEREGNRAKALALLTEAMNHGLAPREAIHMRSDDDLKSMRGDPRFQEILARAEAGVNSETKR
jgi:serine/threonine protein kinase/tetratricopeptide (TPR) repeat protein